MVIIHLFITSSLNYTCIIVNLINKGYGIEQENIGDTPIILFNAHKNPVSTNIDDYEIVHYPKDTSISQLRQILREKLKVGLFQALYLYANGDEYMDPDSLNSWNAKKANEHTWFLYIVYAVEFNPARALLQRFVPFFK